mmetsp:Transcript_354/g.890  ORF Transcript_354/g.890 Transcript_354/m.890 type:complete len:288 (-) Transcript_354:150-1013(-)
MALRRNVRLRKEYLYRKSLEGKERAEYEKKKRIRDALAEGRALPTELRGEESSLRASMANDDDYTSQARQVIDDEYRGAGAVDPKICVTTSRSPSSRLKMFAKEVKLLFPNAQNINRGSTKVTELLEACKGAAFSDLVVLSETRGEPDGLTVCHLPFGPTAYFNLSGAVLRHDIEGVGPVSEQYPHLILNNFGTALGTRISTILKHLFPVPKPDSKRVVTLANNSDYISMRHHTYRRNEGDIELREVGPRFELRCYRIRLGTLEQDEAEDEWVLRPYMRSAKKAKLG